MRKLGYHPWRCLLSGEKRKLFRKLKFTAQSTEAHQDGINGSLGWALMGFNDHRRERGPNDVNMSLPFFYFDVSWSSQAHSSLLCYFTVQRLIIWIALKPRLSRNSKVTPFPMRRSQKLQLPFWFVFVYLFTIFFPLCFDLHRMCPPLR